MGRARLGPPVLAFDWFSKTDAGPREGRLSAAPESGSGPLSLLFGRDSGAEENAPRKTKVTPTPGIARGYTCSVEEIPAAISQGESRRSQGKSPRRAPVGAGLPRGLAERWPSFH